MSLIALEKPRGCISHGQVTWKACLPFVENKQGSLVHRIRSGSTYNIHRTPHISVGFWCGMATTANNSKLTFLNAPTGDKPICERCEAMAVKAGLPTSDELAGHHVHKGKTVAVVTCCEMAKEVK